MARFIEVEIISKEYDKLMLNKQYIVKVYPHNSREYSVIEYKCGEKIEKYVVYEAYFELSKKLCDPEEVYVRQDGGYFRCVVEED